MNLNYGTDDFNGDYFYDEDSGYGTGDWCPSCGKVVLGSRRCEVCGWPEDDNDIELPEELKTKGFYIQTDSGEMAHVLGDPDMSKEELDVLMRIIAAAYKAVDRSEIKSDQDNDQISEQ